MTRRSNSNASIKSFVGALENLRTQSKVADDFTSEFMIELDKAFGQESTSQIQDLSNIGENNDENNKSSKKDPIYDIIGPPGALGTEQQPNMVNEENCSASATDRSRSLYTPDQSIRNSINLNENSQTLVKSIIIDDREHEKSLTDEQIVINQMNDYDLQIDSNNDTINNNNNPASHYAHPDSTFIGKIDNQILADNPPIELHLRTLNKNDEKKIDRNDTIIVSDPQVITKNSISRKHSFVSKAKLQYKDEFYNNNNGHNQTKIDSGIQSSNNTTPINTLEQNSTNNHLHLSIPNSFRDKLSRDVSIRSQINASRKEKIIDPNQVYENVPHLPNSNSGSSRQGPQESRDFLIRNSSSPAGNYPAISPAFSMNPSFRSINYTTTAESELVNRTQSSDTHSRKEKLRHNSSCLSYSSNQYNFGRVSNPSIRTLPNSIIRRPKNPKNNVISMIEDDSFEMSNDHSYLGVGSENNKSNSRDFRIFKKSDSLQMKIDKKLRRHSKSMKDSKKEKASSSIWSLRSSSKKTLNNDETSNSFENEMVKSSENMNVRVEYRTNNTKNSKPLVVNALDRNKRGKTKLSRPASIHLGV